MGSHPINLTLRFLLEIAALLAMGFWGWRQGEGWLRVLLAIGIPLIAAILWGTFAVPDDPSRSGKAPIVTPGIIRLIMELAFFIFACWALWDEELVRLGWILGILVMLHYIVSYDRVLWLINK
jgi:hypothetical protein